VEAVIAARHATDRRVLCQVLGRSARAKSGLPAGAGRGG
jgi:hypothetical protein